MSPTGGPSLPVSIVGVGAVRPAPQPQPVRLPAGSPVESFPAYVCADPACEGLVPPGTLRRLGHIQRMALAAAGCAMRVCPTPVTYQPHGVARPPAVGWPCVTSDKARSRNGAWPCHPPGTVATVVGTGLGALSDTAGFLENMVRLKEREPKPTLFINSVHNTLASWIAIALDCQGENHTFCHTLVSFEQAAHHAMAILRAGRADGVLVCGADEANPYLVAAGIGWSWWRRDGSALRPMTESAGGSGTLPGEGAAAFLFARSDGGAPPPVARLAALRVGPLRRRAHPSGATPNGYRGTEEVEFIRQTMAGCGLDLGDADFVLLGANGDAATDAAYAAVLRAWAEQTGRYPRWGVYKHLCGEFCTAPALGLATAVEIVRTGAVPPGIERSQPGPDAARPRSVLLYHFAESAGHSACLVTP